MRHIHRYIFKIFKGLYSLYIVNTYILCISLVFILRGSYSQLSLIHIPKIMEEYPIEHLLPGFISDDQEGRDLLKWYTFIANIQRSKRRMILYPNMDIKDYYLINFDIDIEEGLKSYTTEDKSVVMSYMDYLKFQLSSLLIPSNDDMKKILFYDIKMLYRLSNTHMMNIGYLLFNILNNNALSHTHLSYDTCMQYMYKSSLSNGYSLTKDGEETPPSVINVSIIHDSAKLSKDVRRVDTMFANASFITYIHMLTDTITHITTQYLSHNDVRYLPRSVTHINVYVLDYRSLFPDTLISLTIRVGNNNDDKNILYLPKTLKALHCSQTKDIQLPLSLVYLASRVIEEDISHLINLKALLVLSDLGYKYTLPPNIIYLYMTIIDYKDRLDKCNKLNIVICNVNSSSYPPNLLYYKFNNTIFDRDVLVPSIKYLIANCLQNIPSNVEYLETDELNKECKHNLKVSYSSGVYLTYDEVSDREVLKKEETKSEANLVSKTYNVLRYYYRYMYESIIKPY